MDRSDTSEPVPAGSGPERADLVREESGRAGLERIVARRVPDEFRDRKDEDDKGDKGNAQDRRAESDQAHDEKGEDETGERKDDAPKKKPKGSLMGKFDLKAVMPRLAKK